MIAALLLLAAVLAALVLRPTLAAARLTPTDTRRTELEEERELLLRSVADLQVEVNQGTADRATQLREKVRLSQVLRELDDLPPAPAAPVAARPAFGLAGGVLLGVAAALVVGGITVFPAWRASGLSAAEATQLASASRLPALERTADRTQATGDFRALGSAAWDARQYKLAARAYTQVLLKERDDPQALRRVGYYLLGDPKMAGSGLSFLRRAVDTDPKAPEGQLLYGYALGLFGQYDQALKVLGTYQALAPDSHEADDLLVQYTQQAGAAVSGALVYAQNCAACHGPQLQGGTGPKLLGAPALQSAEALRARILAGGVGMPAFPQLRGQPLNALVTYLQGF